MIDSTDLREPDREPAAPNSKLNRWARNWETRRQRTSARLRRLPPAERRRVERMPCGVGDAYLERRDAYRAAPDRRVFIPRRGAHRRPSGAKPISHSGSRRATGTSTSRGDPPPDGEDDPPGISHPPARGETAGSPR